MHTSPGGWDSGRTSAGVRWSVLVRAPTAWVSAPLMRMKSWGLGVVCLLERCPAVAAARASSAERVAVGATRRRGHRSWNRLQQRVAVAPLQRDDAPLDIVADAARTEELVLLAKLTVGRAVNTPHRVVLTSPGVQCAPYTGHGARVRHPRRCGNIWLDVVSYGRDVTARQWLACTSLGLRELSAGRRRERRFRPRDGMLD